jgi:amylosucrase
MKESCMPELGPAVAAAVAFRALTRLAAPGLILKAEAIVAPEMLAQYLGAHDRFRPECDLAYDNQLMVMLWSTLATRDVRLAETANTRLRSRCRSGVIGPN